MRRSAVILTTLGVTAIGGATSWRRHPRSGAAWVNRVVDPYVVGHGVADRTHGEIGIVEHVGRTSGIVRVSPVHPVATTEGFRIIVPLGLESQWARNVLAAGGCRLEVGGVVHELDQPVLVDPTTIDETPRWIGHVMSRLGFRYLLVRSVARVAGPRLGMGPSTTVERLSASELARLGDVVPA